LLSVAPPFFSPFFDISTSLGYEMQRLWLRYLDILGLRNATPVTSISRQLSVTKCNVCDFDTSTRSLLPACVGRLPNYNAVRAMNRNESSPARSSVRGHLLRARDVCQWEPAGPALHARGRGNESVCSQSSARVCAPTASARRIEHCIVLHSSPASPTFRIMFQPFSCALSHQQERTLSTNRSSLQVICASSKVAQNERPTYGPRVTFVL
jgi:hypothetical protein